MKRFLLLLSFLFAVIAWADNKPLTETYVESTKVLSSNYFGAEIELSINLEQIEEPVFVCPKISSIERGCIPQLLVHGNNVIRFLVSREFELDAEFITDSVTVDIYTSGNPDQRTLLKTEAPIEILWPGPKVTELEYADSINHSVNYSSLERIYVPYRDPNFSSIIANLVGSGLPLSRIRSSVHPSPESLKRITVGKDVSGVVLASVINAISPMIEGSLELVVFENEKL